MYQCTFWLAVSTRAAKHICVACRENALHKHTLSACSMRRCPCGLGSRNTSMLCYAMLFYAFPASLGLPTCRCKYACVLRPTNTVEYARWLLRTSTQHVWLLPTKPKTKHTPTRHGKHIRSAACYGYTKRCAAALCCTSAKYRCATFWVHLVRTF